MCATFAQPFSSAAGDEAPVVVVVEAKNENMKQGIIQCIAEMVAAQQFNQQRTLFIRYMAL